MRYQDIALSIRSWAKGKAFQKIMDFYVIRFGFILFLLSPLPTNLSHLFFSTFFFLFSPRNSSDQIWDLLATLNPSIFCWKFSPPVCFSSSRAGKNIFFLWVVVERVAYAHLASGWRPAENSSVLAKFWMIWMTWHDFIFTHC